MSFQPIPRSSLSEAVYDQLSAHILDGRFPAGEALPAERVLTAELGVNRGAVREAIQRLKEAGLVETRHGEGSRVLDFRSHAGLDLLPRLIPDGVGGIDLLALRSIIEMRSAIGADAAAKAALRGGPALADRIDALLSAWAALPLEVKQARAVALWELVVEGSENLAYRLAFNSLRRAYLPVLALTRDALSAELEDEAGLLRLSAAIRAQDAAAAQAAARAVLEAGSAGLLALLDGVGGP
jgi:GntR family transcriptional repressor for pyruvate dehydrogenase complex